MKKPSGVPEDLFTISLYNPVKTPILTGNGDSSGIRTPDTLIKSQVPLAL